MLVRYTLALLLAVGGCTAPGQEAPPAPASARYPYQVCDRHPDPSTCARRVEAALIARSGPAVRRSGTRLTIRSEEGRQLLLEDDTTELTPIRFRYAGYYPEIRHHLVELQRYEGGGFTLVEAATNNEVHVNGPPLASPGRTRFVTTSLDLVAGHGPNSVQVWRLQPGPVRLEWGLDGGSSWGASDPVWRGEDAVEFTLHRPTADPMRNQETRMLLHLRETGLELRPARD